MLEVLYLKIKRKIFWAVFGLVLILSVSVIIYLNTGNRKLSREIKKITGDRHSSAHLSDDRLNIYASQGDSTVKINKLIDIAERSMTDNDMKCFIYIDFYYDINEPGRHEMIIRNFEVKNGESEVSSQGTYSMHINYFPIWYEDPMKTDIACITHVYLSCDGIETSNDLRFLACLPDLEYVNIEMSEDVFYSHKERSHDEMEMLISEIKNFLPEGCIVEIEQNYPYPNPINY